MFVWKSELSQFPTRVEVQMKHNLSGKRASSCVIRVFLAVSFPKTFAASLDLGESHKSTAKRTMQDDADLAKVCQDFGILMRIISVLSSKASIRNEVRKCAQKKICSDYPPPPVNI